MFILEFEGFFIENLPDLRGGEVEGSGNEVVLPGEAGRIRKAQLSAQPSTFPADGGGVHLSTKVCKISARIPRTSSTQAMSALVAAMM